MSPGSPAAPRVLWHASRAAIARPTLAGRTVGDNHENSGLGIYCATAPEDYIVGFGQTIHRIELRPDVRVMRLGIAELASLGRQSGGLPGRDRRWFDEQGRRLGQELDVIDLVETDGRVAQAIILNDAAIAACQVLSHAQFAALAQPRRRPSAPR